MKNLTINTHLTHNREISNILAEEGQVNFRQPLT